MAKGKHWKQEEKMAIVLEGLQGTALKEICAKYGVAETQYYRWRDQAFEGMKEALADKRRRESRNSHEAERDRLLKVIGEQAAALDLQKKLSTIWSGERS